MRTARVIGALPALSTRGGAIEMPSPPPGTPAVRVGAPLGLRLKVYLSRWRLDREIAAGHEVEATDAHALRARQLDGQRTRRDIAGSLRDAIDYADHVGSRNRISPAAIVPASARFGRGAILELAEQLESVAHVHPRGVALARMLVGDGLSPLFNRDSERTVSEAAREAIDALQADQAVFA